MTSTQPTIYAKPCVPQRSERRAPSSPARGIHDGAARDLTLDRIVRKMERPTLYLAVALACSVTPRAGKGLKDVTLDGKDFDCRMRLGSRSPIVLLKLRPE